MYVIDNVPETALQTVIVTLLNASNTSGVEVRQEAGNSSVYQIKVLSGGGNQ